MMFNHGPDNAVERPEDRSVHPCVNDSISDGIFLGVEGYYIRVYGIGWTKGGGRMHDEGRKNIIVD